MLKYKIRRYKNIKLEKKKKKQKQKRKEKKRNTDEMNKVL
jgi:hypothetical protein